MRSIDASNLMDRSKGDAFSKGVALLQCVWFIAQWIARISQKLPLTELEVATVAFAVVNSLTWLLWWEKPLDVQCTIPIGPTAFNRTTVIPTTPSSGLLAAIQSAVYGATHHDPASSKPTGVPMLWCPSPQVHYRLGMLLEGAVATVFGAIHCSAWNSDFPSATEKWLWRISSLVVTAIPMFIVLAEMRPHRMQGSARIVPLFGVTVGIYVLSRLVLIVLPFTTLRLVPADALRDVDWAAYMPHMS
ncbi:hypothetical protein C8R43DRAFT_612612 [Mycena crocata]|nr:hypothetical protein C8R43DRAFT_612612 [Mycena crocata]